MRRVMTIAVLLLTLVLLAACNTAATPETTQEEGSTETAATATTGSAAEATTAPAATEPAPASEVAQPTAGAMLQKIKDRGQLICGVNASVPGFGSLASDGSYAGFDIDFCKALAAAIFNDPEAVEYRAVTAQERFTALQTGEIDVLIRNTTYTLTRDTANALDFAPVNFYDGQGMMVRKDSGIETLEDLDGATICVQQGTTTELNLADNFRALGLELQTVTFGEADPVREAYDAGQCDGFTTDKSGLVSQQTLLKEPDAHQILDVTMSKEPLAPSVLQGDPQWADIVNWVVYATIQAEEFGITQDTLDDFLGSEDPNINRFLGGEGELGAGLGLSNDFVVNVIRAVGNYGEIYDRNLGPETPFALPRGQNALYNDGGLLYAPPFR